MGKRKGPRRGSADFRQGANDHERLVAAFCQHSISARGTFHPNDWKNRGQPADMLIVIGRAAIFVNMTKGGSYYEDLVAHNIDQARNRMDDWASGLSITGSNQWRQFDVSWSDIDSIALISVVDGRYAKCERHELISLNLHPKVRLCATLTATAMHSLAIKGAGARDLLNFCVSMTGLGTLSEGEALTLLDLLYAQKVRNVELRTPVPTMIGPFAVANGTISAFQNYIETFRGARSTGQVKTESFSDLDWDETAATAAYLTRSTCEMESDPIGQLRAARFGSLTTYLAVISTNLEGTTEKLPALIEESQQAGDAFVLAVNLLDIGPIITLYEISDRGRATETFLSNL